MKKKYRIKKRRKTISVHTIVLVVAIILIMISVGYAKLSSTLTIRGSVTGIAHEPDLPVEIVPPSGGGTAGGRDRLTTNTSFSSGLLNLAYFTVVRDEFEEPNTVITTLRNGTQNIFRDSVNCTFTLSVQNNSEYTWTNGAYTTEKNNLSQYCSISSASISKVTVQPGETVDLKMVVNFSDTRRTITSGQYFLAKFSYTCNGITKYYNYKVIIQ